LAANMQPDSREYPVYFFDSDTSGEKLYEEFYTTKDLVRLDRFQQMGVILPPASRPQVDFQRFFSELDQLLATDDLDKAALVRFLTEFIPDFHHIETGFSLEEKM
jgi:FlaA1/EpsC-like NDP-sugar epimerase